jgi:putative transposase
MLSDHVHPLISIPPKYAVSQVVGYIKGKSAIHIACAYMGRQRNFTGEHFWARGYYVSTVGLEEDVVRQYIRTAVVVDLQKVSGGSLEEDVVRQYIRTQGAEDQRLDQLSLL